MTTQSFKVQFYKSPKNKQWYWRVRARNGRIVAIAGEGYTRKVNMLRTWYHFLEWREGVVSS